MSHEYELMMIQGEYVLSCDSKPIATFDRHYQGLAIQCYAYLVGLEKLKKEMTFNE